MLNTVWYDAVCGALPGVFPHEIAVCAIEVEAFIVAREAVSQIPARNHHAAVDGHGVVCRADSSRFRIQIFAFEQYHAGGAYELVVAVNEG